MINKSSHLSNEKICRSCMCHNETLRDVFESKELSGQTLQIADMLMDCTAIVIASDDGLPHFLCTTCENTLNVAYEFKHQVRKSDSALRAKNSSNIKQERCDIVVQPDFGLPSIFHESDSDNASSSKKRTTFTCPFCQKVLRTKKGLKIHQRRHTGDKLRACHICDSQFTRTHHLIRHMKKHLKDDESLSNLEKSLEEETVSKSDEVAIETHSDVDTSMEINEEEEEEEEVVNSDEDFKLTPKTKKEKGKYECKYCFKIMTTFVGLKIHMRRHTGSDLAKCKLCDKSFTKTSHLKRHLQTHGIKEEEKPKPVEKKVMECEFCDRKFKYKKSFNHHMQTEHGMSDESDAPLSTYIKKNEATPPETKPEEIPLSDADLPTSKTSKSHVCHVCEAPFTRANHLTRHMTLHRALLIHTCDRCDKAFATVEHLNKHVEEDHINKPYECTICNKPFSRGEHLIRHLKVHQTGAEKEDNLTCSICEKTFSRSDHLARHIKIHLLQDKRHVCAECGKAFNRLDNLKAHQRIHTGIKDNTKLHLCIYCGKEFNNSSNMIVHMRRHTGERPYKCSQCGKGFPRSHDLKCHERTHSGEKPYHCSLCGKSFNKSNKLLRHTRVHTGERPYVCNICGRAFTQSNDLALHMRRHTGARPYACGMCPARFIQSGQLKTHRRSTGHWVETQPDLKGGHRVEPVTPVVEPAPIRFKTHGKPKKEDELLEESPRLLTKNLGMMPINVQAELIETKISELQQHTNLMSFVGGLNKEAIYMGSPVKSEGVKTASPAPSAYVLSPVKSEVSVKSQEECVPTVYQTPTLVTYSIIPTSVPTTTYTPTDFSNYQNFG